MKKFKAILLFIFFFPVMICGYYVSALFTTDQKNTVYTMMNRYQIVKAHPFDNYFSKYTLLICLFFMAFYFVIAIIVIFGEKTRRPGEEAGSSKWESPQRITKMLADHNKSQNDPMNLVVYKPKKLFFLIRFFRNIYFKFKSRKAD